MTGNNQHWDQLISKGFNYLLEQHNDAAAAVLRKASFEVEHTYHDSWRWGTDYWALAFYLKNNDYVALGDKKNQVEKDIMSALVTFQKGSRDLLSTVSVRPALEQSIERKEDKKEHPFQRAAEDAELLIREGRYDSAFDCMYSAFSDFIRHLLTEQDASFETDDRTRTILRSAGETINTINVLRHNTAAHPDGQMLEKREAQLVISLVNSLVDYIESGLEHTIL